MTRLDHLNAITRKPVRRVVGIMSGTSVDGIDTALTEIEGSGASSRVRLLAFRTWDFPPEIRTRVFRLFDPAQARVDQICNLDFILGELFARAVLRLLSDVGIPPEEVDLIGTAGQTIWHDPEPIRIDPGVDWIDEPIVTRSTFAIGESAVLAERTGITTVGDLRVRDVAAGGHGAPLIAYADWVLLRDETIGRCVQNIGGIGNVTWLPPASTIDDVIAFDTGPGNMIIDALVEVATAGQQSFDRDGLIARRGRVNPRILEGWLEDPYFRRKPPKSTGREHFGAQFVRRAITEAQGVSIEDLIATATALTAASIANAYDTFLRPLGQIDEVVVGGGGSRNPALVEMLGERLNGVAIRSHEEFGIDSDAKEALAIAILANDALMGHRTNVPGATGGRRTVLGKLNP